MGLVQREIEEAGFSTITLANVPELTASVSVPRLVGIEHPFGQLVGNPGDVETQKAVMRATLAALQNIAEPGGIIHLPFEWSGDPMASVHDIAPPPITTYLMRHPLQVRNLFKREVPEQYRV